MFDSCCLSQCVAQHAKVSPHSVALEAPTAAMSYEELHQSSDRLARHLIARGTERNDVVGVLLQDPVDVIVSVVGIERTGAAFFILDRDSSPERLRTACIEAGVSLLIADTEDTGIMEAARTVRVRPSIHDSQDNARFEMARPPAGHDLAYVILTSGSTGRPKCVAVEHRSLGIVMRAQNKLLALSGASRVLQSSSLCFDGFVFELLMAFGAGATVVCRGLGERPAGMTLANLLVSRRVTHLVSIPSALMITPVTAQECIEVICAVGEPCPAQLFGRWPTARLFNLYGPAEATIWTTYHEITQPPPARVPIGRPIDGVRCDVLDERLDPVLPGGVGILYVGEEVAARGYLGDPATTADRFVPDQHGVGRRLYKTNDLVRVNEAGQLEFIGRADHQVKVRGFRVDLLEVQAALLDRHGVVRAEVVVDQSEERGSALFAFCIVDDDLVAGSASDLEDDLVQHLLRRLAPQSIPRVVVVDEIPLTAVGKVDQPALLASARRIAGSAFQPEDRLETEIYESWLEVLEVPAIAPRAHFFRVGGSSLQAIRVVGQIGERLGLYVSPGNLFRNPRLEAFIDCVRAQYEGKCSERQSETRLMAQHLTQYPLSLQQEAIWAFQLLHPDSASYTVCEGLRLRGRFDEASLRDALDSALRRHPLLTATISGGSETTTLRWQPSDRPLVEFATPATATTESLAVAALDVLSNTVMGVEGGALFRCVVYPISEGDVIVALLAHHIVWDADSSHLVIGDIRRAFAGEARAPLGDGRSGWNAGDYAFWQREQLAAGALEVQRQFWRRHLKGTRPLQLFASEGRTTDTSAWQRDVRLDAALERAARRFAAQCGVSMFVVLLTAFACSLRRWTGADDFVVGVPMSNRRFRPMEDAVGFLVSTVLFRFQFESMPTGRTLVARTSEQLSEFQSHLDVPAGPELPGSGAQVDVIFSFDDRRAGTDPETSPVRCERIPLRVKHAKVALTLALSVSAGLLGGFGLARKTGQTDAQTLDDVWDEFTDTLDLLCREPDQPVSSDAGTNGDDSSFAF